MKVYSFYDEKLSEFGNPILAQNDGIVCRQTSDMIRGSNSGMEKHAEDYKLMEIGGMDMSSGELSSTVPPRFIIYLHTLLGATK